MADKRRPDDDARETDQRRTAKRRPAGSARPTPAANDDLPSIGGLIFALHQKPSKRPMQLAAIASVVWLILSGGLGWAMLAPEWKRAAGLADLLTKPTAIMLAAAVVIPIALFWFLAMLVVRAQELKLMSSAMTEVAIRLAEPDRMAEQQIASLGQSVRRQVNHMNDAVELAMGRATELEALVQNEVSNLERSYMQNEHRIRSLLGELSGERHALINTSERVNVSLKELGTEIPTLIDKLGEQQIKLARFIEDAGRNLVAMESSIATNAGTLATAVGGQTAELNNVLTHHSQQIHATLTDGTQRFQAALVDGSQQIEAQLSSRAEQFTSSVQLSAQRVEDGIQRAEEGMDRRMTALGEALTTHTDTMQGVFDTFSDGLNEALGDRTAGIQTVLEEYTRALDQTMESRQGQLESQLVERTRTLDAAFAQRITHFDEAILRSTIAIDSAVAEKARALSSALETHGRDIAHALGRQAGEMDQQIMHGVQAVRRASENVTKQSLKAIEGLAGQADLLKTVSENLVDQVGSVTNRFDVQGQSIMRAANALESANARIDKTLQGRQMELSETLDKLSGKAEDIDRVLRGYSTSLEGTFDAAEARARVVGEHLSRSTEERSRQALGEIERLQIAASGETDRALADLRSRFSTISRDVSSEIDQLSTRFGSSSEEMRRQAQRTLAEIESEQARLKAQLDRMPDAARQTAETMRSSLQEQLRALEQLSTLSSREAARADVSPPMSTLQPMREAPAAPVAQRSISSLTQSVANEMARGRTPEPLATAGSFPQSQQPIAPSGPTHVPATAEPSRALAPRQQPARPEPAQGARDGWSLGDLLARASQDEEANRAQQAGQGATGGLNIAAIARALDATTASAIWSRFRAGQRGVMVRSIYSVEGRGAFDEVQKRYQIESPFRETVDRYMLDFEQLLRDGDARDPSGRTTQGYITSDSGRVYLFLTHASGRLA